jgi:hypothetical protein
MKKITQNFIAPLIYSLAIFHSTALLAESSQAEDQSGGFLKIGYGFKFAQTPLNDEIKGGAMFLSGRYQMENGLFIEASFGANKLKEGLSVGYNFYNIPNWNFDITTVQSHGGTEIFGVNDRELPEEPGTFERTIVRVEEDESEMLGFRATGTFDNTSVQFVFAPISFNNDYDDGIYSSLWVARTWQARNWELYASAGIEYRSEEILSHYYEPTIELQSVGFPAYDADDGFDVTLQIGTSYPVSENILFESYLRYTDFADSITDSPIVRLASQFEGRDENETEFGILFSYVF